ncbi:MAG: TrkA family potassium uptake protein [Clostridiales bacterium]|nr:TrkA family potassium uptake protein [Clostridiales bacterium]
MSDRKQYIIFGVGRFGSALARTLNDLGHEVLAIDSEESRVAAIAPHVTSALQVSAMDEEGMRSLGIRNFDAAIVAIGDNLEHSIMACILCKELGAKYIVGKATDAMHAKVLRKLGVDRVVFPERDMGERVAHSLTSPHLLDLISLDGDYVLVNLSCPKDWAGKTLREADIRRRHQVTLLALYHGNDMSMDITPDTLLAQEDRLLVLGRRKAVEGVEALD